MVTLKYSEISSFQFAQAVQKISSTPTHGQVASQIHKVTRQLTKARDQISKEYQAEIVEKYGKRDDKGALIRPDGQPNGFEPMEEKEADFLAAQEAFGGKTVELNCQPFTVQLLGDIKVSAQDLESLKALYAGNEDAVYEDKPPVPNNVASIR